MQLILVRHAQPNREHNPDGPADPGLSELGQWQAARLGEWLAHEPIDYIVTSPKRRAIETVGALIDDGHPHEIIDALNELDSRAQWYYPTEELHLAGEYWDAIQRQDWDSIGWDSPDVFNARVTEAFADLVANHRGQHVLVSSHGGVVRRIVADVLGHDHMRLPITISYASITRVDVEPDAKRTLVSLKRARTLRCRPTQRGASDGLAPALTGGRTDQRRADQRRGRRCSRTYAEWSP